MKPPALEIRLILSAPGAALIACVAEIKAGLSRQGGGDE